jgi:hypothetical protein
VKTLAALVMLASAAPAGAGTLREALDRHGPKDVDVLREQRADLATRCTLGAVYARRNDLPRAALYLDGCDDATLPGDVAADIAKADRDVKRALRDSDLSLVQIVTHPDHMIAEIDALPGETFPTPAEVYVPAGTHTVHATLDGSTLTNSVTVGKHGRTLVIVGNETQPKPNEPRTGKVDFTEPETAHAGPPPDQKHPSLLHGTKYDKKPVATADNPNALEDPLAYHETFRAPRTYWIGLRLGGGMFDDGAAAARPGVAIAATGRFTLRGDTFLATRIDWSRRGAGGIDTMGASAGAGQTIVDTHDVGIAVLAQLRGDLRFGTMSVNRAGVTAAAGLEVSLPRTPFSAGLRFEQGLTTIVDGTRDRAMLFELGVDWR